MSRSASADAGLAIYRVELVRWAGRMNLVGSTDDASLERHFDDSLQGAADVARGARVADLGSGAGFPGIPIAIARPDVRMTLVEIREKRVAFLRHVVRALDLPIEIIHGSLDSPPESGFDLALLRAVAPPPESARIGARWAAPTGEVWIWAGPSVELAGARPIPLRSGGAILRLHAADLSRGTS